MSKMIDILCLEHRSMESVLDVLDSEIGNLVEGNLHRQADFRIAWSAIDYFTDFPELVHRPKEEMIFDRLTLIDPALAAKIGDMRSSHESLAGELPAVAAELKVAMENPGLPRTTLIAKTRGFVKRERRHFEMEEALFYPLAERLLDAQVWTELERHLNHRIDPLIGGEAGDRFEALRRNIVGSVGASLAFMGGRSTGIGSN